MSCTIRLVIYMLLLLLGTTHQPCNGSQFQCHDGQCIPSGWECDGEQDCANGEDENQPKCCKCSCVLMVIRVLCGV